MSSKILRINLSYTAGEDDYSINQSEISITAAILEITKSATSGLRKSNRLTEASTFSFTFYVSEKNRVFPFFFGKIK